MRRKVAWILNIIFAAAYLFLFIVYYLNENVINYFITQFYIRIHLILGFYFSIWNHEIIHLEKCWNNGKTVNNQSVTMSFCINKTKFFWIIIWNDQWRANWWSEKYILKNFVLGIKLLNQFVYLGIRLIKSEKVENVMKSVDRGDFVQEIQYAYENDYQLIGYGASISSPNALRKKILWKTFELRASLASSIF